MDKKTATFQFEDCDATDFINMEDVVKKGDSHNQSQESTDQQHRKGMPKRQEQVVQDSHSPIKNEEVRLELQSSCKKDHHIVLPNPQYLKPAEPNSSLSLGGLLDSNENDKQI